MRLHDATVQVLRERGETMHCRERWRERWSGLSRRGLAQSAGEKPANPLNAIAGLRLERGGRSFGDE